MSEQAFVYLTPLATNSTDILSFQIEDGQKSHAKINKKIKTFLSIIVQLFNQRWNYIAM